MKMKNKKTKIGILIVFTPGVVTLGAAEESYLGFIGTSQLSEPPFRQVVAAVRTGNLNCRFCSEVFVAVHNQNIILLHVGNFLHLVFLFFGNGFLMAAFGTNKFTVSCLHEFPTVWTKHHAIKVCLYSLNNQSIYP